MKHCPVCDGIKDRTDFYSHKSRYDGLRAECKDCTKASASAYYDRMKQREVADKPITKTCSKCGTLKSCDEFFNNPGNRDGLRSMCKDCGREEKRTPERKLSARDSRLRQKFGITLRDYAEMFTMQSSGCAICGEQPENKALAVDHDHDTGRVRGLLCYNCNVGLGNFQDDPELLASAMRYIQQFLEDG